MNVNDILRDLAIRHGVYLDRYATGEIAAMLAVVDQAAQELLGKIALAETKYTKAWLVARLKETNEIVDELRTALQATIAGLQPLAAHEVVNLTEDIQFVAPIAIHGVDIGRVWASVNALPAAKGSTLAEMVDAYEQGTRRAFYAAIRQGWNQHETMPQIAARVRDIVPAAKRGAESAARTAIGHVSNTARHELMQANADVLSGEMWLATLDSATCMVCGSLDGHVWDIGTPHEYPPDHPNCRCVISPVVKSWRELGVNRDEVPEGTRAAMNGQVPASVKFRDWLKGQPRGVQEEVLGKARTAMFRAGLPLANMVDRGGVLTLKELAAKDAE